ncbi:MAG TPA: hypothetical protein VMU97_01700 [Candidatus Dormibacteraeota bacterium]|nr:hypothetical protein [Candidatus Dormibacteraeota bacterium]
MDFSNRNVQPQAAAPGAPNAAAGAPSHNSHNKKGRFNDTNKWGRIGLAALVAAVVILLIALVASVSFGGVKSEDKYVDTNKLQAVFLNTGQVYFGNVKALNSKYVVLTNIYYLQTSGGSASGSSSSSSASSNSNITLVKLGCELHEPYDQMVINNSQVTFWENLQDNGQVAKAVQTFEKQNPNGQKCSDQSSSASTNSANSTQNAGTTSKP